MAMIDINGTSLYYQDIGPSNPKGVVVLSHGLMMSADMFAAQIDALKDSYRVIAYDHRGQGRSSLSPDDNLSMELLYQDACALIEKLAPGQRVHFAGLSMGGFVGMRLAARRPDLLQSVTLLDTSAGPEPKASAFKYRLLNFVARYVGVWAVVDQGMPILFGKSFLADPTRSADREKWKAWLVSRPNAIYRAVAGVIERPGVMIELSRVTIPTLVMCGEEDVATTPDKSQAIAAAITGAQLVMIPRAGHSSTVENPEAVTAALTSFLATFG